MCDEPSYLDSACSFDVCVWWLVAGGSDLPPVVSLNKLRQITRKLTLDSYVHVEVNYFPVSGRKVRWLQILPLANGRAIFLSTDFIANPNNACGSFFAV